MLSVHSGRETGCSEDGHYQLQSLLVEDSLNLESAAGVVRGGSVGLDGPACRKPRVGRYGLAFSRDAQELRVF